MFAIALPDVNWRTHSLVMQAGGVPVQFRGQPVCLFLSERYAAGSNLPADHTFPLDNVELPAIHICREMFGFCQRVDNVGPQIGRGKRREEILGPGELDLQQPA
jgi:hypothetical protein